MRGCAQGLSDDARRLAHRSKSHTKTKRACDECAKANAKCDGQKPCDRCRRQAIKCEKTRNGYEDPYGIYSIQDPVLVDVRFDASSSEANGSHKDGDRVNSDLGDAAPHFGSPSVQSTATCPNPETYFQWHEAPNNMTLVTSDKEFNMSPFFGDYGLGDNEEFSSGLDQASTYFSNVGSLDYLFGPHNLVASPVFSLFIQPSRAFTGDGFSLARLDPIEVKCNEIIDLLKRSDPSDSGEDICHYITRKNIVYSCYLYGKHFQRNFPIIHSPSFDIVKSPPILLLAVMLVGACYAKDSIRLAQVTKFAIRLPIAIGAEPASIKVPLRMLDVTNLRSTRQTCSVLQSPPFKPAYSSAASCRAREMWQRCKV